MKIKQKNRFICSVLRFLHNGQRCLEGGSMSVSFLCPMWQDLKYGSKHPKLPLFNSENIQRKTLKYNGKMSPVSLSLFPQ